MDTQLAVAFCTLVQHTLVMPYMVCGRITVSSGVLWRGVLLPNTAMVLGAYTDKP
jgi:hypothetical protein